MSYTLAQLSQALQDFLETDETTFVANVGQFVRLAEERIVKSVQLSEFYKEQTITLTPSTATVSLPADLLAFRSVLLKAGDNRTLLEQKDTSFANEYWPDATETGTPKFYAFEQQDLLRLAPTPASANQLVVRYVYRPQSLVDVTAGQMTWLSEYAPDAMLYGALVEAAIFQKAEPADIQLYDGRFVYAVQRLKNLGEAEQPIDHLRFGQIRVPRS